ncbi:hypothetical protein AJ78_03541 [Emergomyces pasteurianus Ep9510]|uniref:Uncharacterized protein n=1 Tax=Emergomyces pasteurianus Ep9510 TaxID=1447872 RepID=A0A1J9PK84_9EURO|nr:hypothetical protein AJ78_03541 [Emergomyces pasteurianus Ep9510]
MHPLLSRVSRNLRLGNKIVDKLAPSVTKIHHNGTCSAFGADQQRHVMTNQDSSNPYYYEKPLTVSQLREIRIGRFPANIHEEGIRYRSSWETYQSLLPPMGKKPSLPELRISYDARFSTTAIDRAPTNVHGLCIAHFSHRLFGGLPRNVQSSLEFETNSTVLIHHGDKCSERKPDIAITHKTPDKKRNLVGVTEVGFSQSYADLKRWCDLWFDGVPTINMVILFNLIEKPRFPRKEAHEYIQKQGQQNFPDIKAIKEDDFILQDPTDATSALTAYGFTWCGPVQATLEIWTRCPETKSPLLTSKPVHFYGPNVDEQPIKIQPRDFLPPSENGIYDDVELDVNGLRDAMEAGRKKTARDRCIKRLKAVRGIKERQRWYSA